MEGIRIRSTKREQTTVKTELLAEGNCIPRALPTLGYCQAVKKFLEDTKSERATYMRRLRRRTYGQFAAGTGVSLLAYSLDLPSMPLRAKYLIHLGAHQKPHCMAMEVAEKDFLRVLDGKSICTISREVCWRTFSAACDQRHSAFFRVCRASLSQTSCQVYMKGSDSGICVRELQEKKSFLAEDNRHCVLEQLDSGAQQAGQSS